jgi:hypothetical protein
VVDYSDTTTALVGVAILRKYPNSIVLFLEVDMTTDLDKDTYINYCFILRGKYRDFLKIKEFILDSNESKLLFDKCSFSPLICKERIPTEEE